MKSEDLSTPFSLPRDGFSSASLLVDGVGFSTMKHRKQNGRDFASLYKFYIIPEALVSNSDPKPLIISVSYGEVIPEGISLTPKNIKRRRNWPIDLISRDEYFYDSKRKIFYRKERVIEANKLLSEIEKLHLKPTKRLKGLYFRFKSITIRELPSTILVFTYEFLIKILYIISGTKTKKSIVQVAVSGDSISNKDNSTKEIFANEKINIFGYQASAWSVFTYSVFHLLAYTLWYLKFRAEDISYFSNLFQNPFLTLSYVISSLVFFERIIPRIIETGIIWVGLEYRETAFKSIRI